MKTNSALKNLENMDIDQLKKMITKDLKKVDKVKDKGKKAL